VLGVIVMMMVGLDSKVVAGERLRVAAASSLAGPLKELNVDFEKRTGTAVQLTLGSSHLLARQIVAGASVDVFVSADAAAMDQVSAAGMIEEGTRENQFSNTLVVVVPTDGGRTLVSLRDLGGPGIRRIATGNPRTVPVGVYARQYLEKLGLWEVVAPKIIAAETARAALAAVESGNAEVGVVYRTDALLSKKVRVVFEVAAGEGPPIVYPMAAVKGEGDRLRVRQYLEFLDTEAARKVFERFGFIVLPETDGNR
jgi:molybdate transport system substrate-binding protein